MYIRISHLTGLMFYNSGRPKSRPVSVSIEWHVFDPHRLGSKAQVGTGNRLPRMV